MEIEELNLDDFDINTIEPPKYNINSYNDIELEDETYNENLKQDNNDKGFDRDLDDNDQDPDLDQDQESDSDDQELINISTLHNLEVNNIDEDIDENYVDIDECDNIIYSYPFFSLEGIDYEYRVTITDDTFILESVKCDDTKYDFNDCVSVIDEIYKSNIKTELDIIVNNKDIRNSENTVSEGIIDYTFENLSKEELKNKIDNNKVAVLYELYKEILYNLYDI